MNKLKGIFGSRDKSRYTIGFFASMLMVLIMLVPDLNTIGTETMILVSTLWIPGLTLIKIPNSINKVLTLLFAYLCIIVLYKGLGVSTAWWDIAAGYFGCMMCAYISVESLCSLSQKQLKILQWTIYVVSVLAMVYVSIQGMRNLATMDLEEAISQEAASYGSSVIILSGISLIGLLYSRRKIIKLLYLISIILSLYVTFVIMQRGTNVVMGVLLLAAILFFRFFKISKPGSMLFVVTIFLAIAYYSGWISAFLDMVIGIVPSERLQIRFAAIKSVLDTGDALDAGSSMTTRSELMILSWNTFKESLSSVLFGIGDHRGYGAPIGNHSEIIDSLARYGIFWFFILIAYFVKLLQWWYRILPSKSSIRYQVCCIFIIYIARNIFGNAMTSAISILLFLYLPLVLVSSTKLSTLRH